LADTSDSGLGTVRALPAGAEADERLLWRRFAEAETAEVFFRCWLDIQCRTIGNVQAGLLLSRATRSGSWTATAHWPAERQPGAHVRAAAEKVLQARRALALQLAPQGDAQGSESRTVIARPVEVAGEIDAVVVLDVAPRPESELEQALRQLTWGCAWLELHALRGSLKDGPAALLQILATPLEQERFKAAATAFTTEMATRFDCERVSLGLVQRKSARLLAISHTSQFDKRANLTRILEAAMDEVLDQEQELLWPPGPERSARVTRAHDALARESKAGAICSFPIVRGSRFCGAVVFERREGEAFSESEVALLDAAVELAGPLLDLKYREDRPLAVKALASTRRTLAHLVGPRHVALKLAAGTTALVLAFLVLARGDFRVTSDFALEPRVLRAAVAPFDGYVIEAPVRAGDLVRRGELLAVLDDQDLALELERFSSQLEEFTREYRRALAERDAPNVRILGARLEQVRAQRALAMDQVSRTRIEAPFDGIVVTGDLSQKLGSPVARGDLLFEVAPLDEYRAILEVDERDVAEVADDQQGQLVFAAFPDEPIPFRVEKITPVSVAKEGRNSFRVEAQLLETPERLRPGLEGVAKLEVDRRRLIWIWSHRLVDWLRLSLWRWLP